MRLFADRTLIKCCLEAPRHVMLATTMMSTYTVTHMYLIIRTYTVSHMYLIIRTYTVGHMYQMMSTYTVGYMYL